jgi:hypothetical protein
MTRSEVLQGFVEWCQKHIKGDEKGEAQIFLDRLFQAFEHASAKEAGATFEERVHKSRGGGFGDGHCQKLGKPFCGADRWPALPQTKPSAPFPFRGQNRKIYVVRKGSPGCLPNCALDSSRHIF